VVQFVVSVTSCRGGKLQLQLQWKNLKRMMSHRIKDYGSMSLYHGAQEANHLLENYYDD